MIKDNTYFLNHEDSNEITLGEFLTKEMGVLYEDIIELDWTMGVEEFCGMFVGFDEDGCWVSGV